jgi:hypothetical protein
MIVKKVKLKTYKELKEMARKGKIEILHVSDSGEVMHFGTIGNPSHVLTVWADNLGEEYLIIDHPNTISKDSYEDRKIFFDDIKESK